jgi:carbamoyltransferase
MKDVLNAKVKHREGFRPFAPAILAEHRHAWFEGEHDSPFMLLAMPVREDKRDRVPAITHVDGTARVQTVHAETNPRFYKLIEAFAGHTGVPIVVNTSFNVRGEPIVCTPHDAYSCFARTRMDYLVMDRYIVKKPADAHDGRGR